MRSCYFWYVLMHHFMSALLEICSVVPLALHSFFIVGNIVLFLLYLIRSCEHSRHMTPLSSFIAEHFSVRLLILQCVFSVGGCGPNFLPSLGLQLKVWLVCKHRPTYECN